MFTIKDVDFQSEDYGVEPYINNWPMLYILENGKNAYIVGFENARVTKRKREVTLRNLYYCHNFFCKI